MRVAYFVALMLSVCICTGCRQSQKKIVIDPATAEEQLLRVNKQMVRRESDSIRKFLEESKWQVQETGSGLRIHWLQNTGKPDDYFGKLLRIRYRVFFLDGQTVFERGFSQAYTIQLGKGMEIKGLEEGLALMAVGSKANLIIPSHLAYGLYGDRERIPGATPLRYEVELLKVQEQEQDVESNL